ncbi:MAG: 30S ribosomal protein S17 [Candidatus Diapherotrites archaeon]|nr:30S ribosomal protein S17 [Candidatus Diapherotrites archaeon]
MADNCNDKHCPKHGNLKVHGRTFVGKVARDKMKKTVVVINELVKYVPKYKRYMKTRSRISAHNPACLDAKLGDTVKIEESRKLSKTKAFVVTEIIKL